MNDLSDVNRCTYVQNDQVVDGKYYKECAFAQLTLTFHGTKTGFERCDFQDCNFVVNNADKDDFKKMIHAAGNTVKNCNFL